MMPDEGPGGVVHRLDIERPVDMPDAAGIEKGTRTEAEPLPDELKSDEHGAYLGRADRLHETRVASNRDPTDPVYPARQVDGHEGTASKEVVERHLACREIDEASRREHEPPAHRDEPRDAGACSDVTNVAAQGEALRRANARQFR